MHVRWNKGGRRPLPALMSIVLAFCLLLSAVEASIGDRLPEFRECVKVCKRANCDPNNDPTPIPLIHRVLQWSCLQECDYTCQQLVTARRVESGKRVVQFHGKWPFVRVLGVQEPLSVAFSIGNLLAHHNGLVRLREQVAPGSPMLRNYIRFAYVGIATWVFSAVFHTRDFRATEQLDYFGAGASVLYAMYTAFIRVTRLDIDRPPRRRLLRLWTGFCASLYLAHVVYLKFWRWDYGYNMKANIVVGMVHNLLWIYLSWKRWRETHQRWTILPSFIVLWIMLAMGLELLDFPPLWGALDAHSLWHLGTIVPGALWYTFFIWDSQEMAKQAKFKESKA